MRIKKKKIDIMFGTLKNFIYNVIKLLFIKGVDDMDKYCIYIHRNKINNKSYIGQTKQIPEKRWLNGKGYKEGTRIRNAIEKYGWNNFESLIFANNLTKEQADDMEIKLIALFNTTGENGYNICSGGSCNSERRTAKKVKQYDFNGNFINEYPSYEAAARATGCDPTTISAACTGKRNTKTGAGFIWRSCGNTPTPEECREILKTIKENKTLGLSLGAIATQKPVYKIDKKTGNVLAEYSSYKAAADANNTYYQKVARDCKPNFNPNLIKGRDYYFKLKE